MGNTYKPPTANQILKSLKPGHPRLMINADTPRRIRQLIAEDQVAKSIFDHVIASADKTLKEKPETHRLPDGRRLLKISSTMSQRIQTLAFAYIMTKEKRYLDRAWKELEAAAGFKDWNPAHFLDTAVMTNGVALGYDWLWDEWTPEQRAVLQQAIVKKGLTPAMKVYGSKRGWHTGTNNWNQIGNGGIGMGALAIADQEPELAGKILANGLASIPRAMKVYAPDGGGEEGVTYWDFGSRYNVLFIAALDSALGTDFGLSGIDGFKQSGDFQIYLSGTGLLSFDFGDCAMRKISCPQHFWMGKKFDIPRYSWFRYNALQSGLGGGITDLLWFDTRGKSYDHSKMPLDRHFRDAEKVSMRDSWNEGEGFIAALEGGKNRVSHSHMDGGTFILEADGIRWIMDSGKDSQTYQRHKNKAGRYDFYRVRTEGHNTLVINPDAGSGQNTAANTIFKKFESQKDHARAVLDLSSAYKKNAQKVTRTYELVRGKHFTVTDEITCKAPASIWSFFHTDAKVELSPDKHTATFKKGGKTLKAELVAPVTATFEVLPAEPAKGSPQLSFQASNKGRRKLTVHLDKTTAAKIVVRFLR